MTRSLITLLLCVISAVLSLKAHSAQEKPSHPIISADLKSLIAVSDYLSDAILKVKDREFVKSQMTTYSVYYPNRYPGYGWRDAQGVIHFSNGSTSESETYKSLDFKKHCEESFKRYLKKRTKEEILEENMMTSFDEHKQLITPALAAIWMYRLGETKQAHVYWKIAIETYETLFQESLRIQRENAPPADPWRYFLSQLGGNSPWSLFESSVGAHMYDKSDLSLELLTRLKKISPHSLKQFGNGEQLLADLQRRAGANAIKEISGKNLPPAFKTWDLKKRIRFLISRLDQINEPQNGQPGGVDLASDWRVYELIRIGDPAIPALIDCLEKDHRLTRSCHYWRSHYPSRTILSVKEAALTAIMSILQEPLYETASTGSNFTSREATQTEKLVKHLRDYWKIHGKTERSQRFMNRLTDSKAGIDSRLDALELLAWADYEFTLGTTFATGGIRRNQQHDQHPLLNKFSDPTLAEAAWELTKTSLDKAENHQFILYAIAKIKDPRIAPSLTEAYKAETSIPMKLHLASTADACGDSALIVDFATEFLNGTMYYKTEDLVSIINAMVESRHPKCEQMLDAFTDKNHANYQIILKGLLTDETPFKGQWDDFDSNQIEWKHHPFAIKVLIDQLNNKTLTDDSQEFTEDNIILAGDPFGNWHDSMLADWLKTQRLTKDKVQLRVCDIAALRLQDIIFDLPFYSPLLIEKDKALAQFQQILKTIPVKELPETLARHLGQGEYIRRHHLYSLSVIKQPSPPKKSQRKFPSHFDERGEVTTLESPISTYLLNDKDQPDLSNPIIIIQVEKSPAAEDSVYGCLSIYGLEIYYAEEIKLTTP